MPGRVPVDDLGLVGLDRADDLVGQDLGPQALGLVEPEVLEDAGARLQDLALVLVVDLEQAVGALDHLDRGLDLGRLERDVGDLVDRDARRDLDPHRGLARHRQEAARGLAHEGRELRLQRVEETVRAERGRHPGRATYHASAKGFTRPPAKKCREARMDAPRHPVDRRMPDRKGSRAMKATVVAVVAVVLAAPVTTRADPTATLALRGGRAGRRAAGRAGHAAGPDHAAGPGGRGRRPVRQAGPGRRARRPARQRRPRPTCRRCSSSRSGRRRRWRPRPSTSRPPRPSSRRAWASTTGRSTPRLSASATKGSNALGLFTFDHRYQGTLSAGLSRSLSTGGTVSVRRPDRLLQRRAIEWQPDDLGRPDHRQPDPAADARPRPPRRPAPARSRPDWRATPPSWPAARPRLTWSAASSPSTGAWSPSEQAVVIAKASLGLAEERLRVTQLGVKGGKVADSELLAVEEAIATRQEDVINAEVAVIEQSVALRRAVGMEIGPGQHRAGDPGRPDRAGPELEPRRPARPGDRTRARSWPSSPPRRRTRPSAIEVTENGLLPQLDLDLTLGPLGSDRPPSGRRRTWPSWPGPTVSAGLTYTQALGKHAARGRTRAQRAARERIRVNAQDLRRRSPRPWPRPSP